MATTTKNSSTKKKAAAPKKAVAKKTPVKKAPIKKVTTKSNGSRSKTTKAAGSQSFKLAKNDKPFLTFTPSLQTIYWLILGVIVIAFAAWILKLQADIQSIYDQIDQDNAQSEILDIEELKAMKEHKDHNN